MKNVTTLKELARRLDKDPEYRKEHRRQTLYHDLLLEIIRRRKELGLTQEELAEKAGTYQSRISKIEAAEHDIQFSTLIQIAEALDARVDIRLVPLYREVEKEWKTLISLPSVEPQSEVDDYTESQAPSVKVKV